MHVFYLHGFASSPQSSKATFFAERLAAYGVGMHCPDFNQPDFATLTVSRMLEQLETRIAALPPGDVVLVGSSLGGLVAIEAAARMDEARHPVTQLILLAPAVELEWDKWDVLLPGGVDAWRRQGSLEVFHYAHGEPRRLKFDFYEDAQRYRPALRRLAQPMLIFQGREDESVSPSTVEAFARAQPRARLHLLNDGHQLKNSLELIWNEIITSAGNLQLRYRY